MGTDTTTPAELVETVRTRLAESGAKLTPHAVAAVLRDAGRPVGDATVLAVYEAVRRDAATGDAGDGNVLRAVAGAGGRAYTFVTVGARANRYRARVGDCNATVRLSGRNPGGDGFWSVDVWSHHGVGWVHVADVPWDRAGTAEEAAGLAARLMGWVS